MKKLFFACLFALLPLLLQAQRYPLGLNPSDLDWKQINTERVQVIFPEGIEEEAQRVANVIHYLYDFELENIGTQQDKITIILQNQTTVPNGFVALSPFRSEFYMTPPQFNLLGTGDWLDLLAIHEYRHVQQTTNARQGLTGLFSTVLGQNALALFRRVALPRWYLEGDAVGVETAYTTSGRGRLPAFDMEYRALRLGILGDTTTFEPLAYNYEKASAGSLREFVPNHYNLGYYLTTYARRTAGEEIWKDVLSDAVQYKGLLFPFSRGLKKRAGLRTPQLYRGTMQYLDSLWLAQAQEIQQQGQITDALQLTEPRKNTYVNYSNPHYLGGGLLLVEKSSFKQINTFVVVDQQGNESQLLKPGINFLPQRPLSARGGKVVWTEARYHPRWGNKDYSVIKIADVEPANPSETTSPANVRLVAPRQLTEESRYFAPSVSHSGQKIVAVHAPASLEYSLVLLDASSGDPLKTLPNPENYFFSFPNWLPDDSRVAVVAQKNHRQALLLADPQTGDTEEVLPFGNSQILNPFPNGDYIYFSGTWTGINNIFAVNYKTGRLFQLTNSLSGAFQPSVSANGQMLAYTEYTAEGYMLQQAPLRPEVYKPVDPAELESIIQFYEPLVEQTGGSILEEVPEQEFAVKDYRKIGGLLNPHSIQPFVNHPNYSIEIQSEDKMTTTQAAVGYSYNVNENSGNFYGRLSYAEFFPVLDAGFDLLTNRERLSPYLEERVTETDTALFKNYYVRSWSEQDYHAGITLPFNLTSGNHFSNLLLSGKLHALRLNYQNNGLRFQETENQRSGWVNTLDLAMRFSRLQAMARQHLNPRFGQILDLRYMSTFGNQLNQGSVFRARGTLFLPGVSANHSFYVSGAWQREALTNTYQFRDNFFYPRGYNSILHDQISTLRLNYSLPLLYPDLALGPFAFLQRIKANLFFDVASVNIDAVSATELPNNTRFNNIGGTVPARSETYRSAGVELSFDFRALRLLEMSLGARYSYLLDTDNLSSFRMNQHRVDFIVLGIGRY